MIPRLRPGGGIRHRYASLGADSPVITVAAPLAQPNRAVPVWLEFPPAARAAAPSLGGLLQFGGQLVLDLRHALHRCLSARCGVALGGCGVHVHQ